MNFSHLIKRAWTLTWKHKFLWIFGLFAGGLSFPSGNMTSWMMPTPAPEGTTQEVPGLLDGLNDQAASLFGIVAHAAADPETPRIITNLFDRFGNIGFGIALAIFLLALVYIMVTFQAGLMWSVDRLDEHKKITFWDGWRAGRGFFWRYFLLGLYIGALILALFLALVIPVYLLFVVELYYVAVPLLVLALLVFVVFCIVASVVQELASRFLILDEQGIAQSVRTGWMLLRTKLGNTALVWLVESGLSLGLGIVALIVLAILAVPAFLIGVVLISAAPETAFLTYAVIAGTVLIVILAVLVGWVGSFRSAFWTLSYRELTK